MGIKNLLNQIPNDVSGDGKRFAMALKKFLLKFSTEISEETDKKMDSLGEGAAEQVIGLSLTETHTTNSNGMPQNNIVVEYDTTNVTNFAAAQIWLSSDQGEHFEQVGSSGGLKYIIEDVKAGTTYIVKVVATNKNGGTSVFDEAPQASITIKGSVLIPDVPKQFVLTWDEEGPLWEWLHEDNGYVDFFELRLDANAGEYNDKLLDRTRAFQSRANPKVRSGTAYLFVRNIFGTYSQPAIHQFSKPVGTKPDAPVLSALLSGVNIYMEPLPEGYTGYKLFINGEDFTSKNNEFVYFLFSGNITVKYCFVDDIGEGEYSDEVTADVKQLIEASDIAGGAVGSDQLANGAVGSDQIADNAITDVKIVNGAIIADKLAANSVTTDKLTSDSVTADKLAANSVTTAKIAANAITSNKIDADAVTADKIAADAITADKIAAEAITSEAIQAGSIIGQHISAGAVTAEKVAAGAIDAHNIKANAITSEKIDAGAITAEKINVDTLSAITATIGTLRTATSGARMEIKDNLIEVYDANGRLRVRMGVWE